MPKWTIEGTDQQFGCFGKCWTTAAKTALRTRKEVIVRFHGQKEPGNSNPAKSDFKISPNGVKDFSIDPTWKGR